MSQEVSTYLDVGVVQIQHYLTQPRHLRSQRDRSAMIKVATSRYPEEYADPEQAQRAGLAQDGEFDPIAQVCAHLSEERFPGWRRNDAAGDIDGVVSLVRREPVNGDGPPAQADNPDEAMTKTMTQIANIVIAHLRRKLPHAEFSARFTGPTHALYVEAYPTMKELQASGLAFGNDYPALLTCDECGRTPVTAQYEFQEPTARTVRRVCEDCGSRERLGRFGKANPKNSAQASPSLTVEEWLLEAINQCLRSKIRPAEHFADLANAQSGRRVNHLATVFIDGDAMGVRFQELTDPKQREKAVAGLSEVAKKALIGATKAICKANDAILPVIPHVLGGDDAVATVTATAAWPFVREFLKLFEEEAGGVLPGATASAAIVFAKHTTPFALQFDRAERVLRATKRAGARLRYEAHLKNPIAYSSKGTSSIGWADFTREYIVPTDRFHPTIRDLNLMAPKLEKLAQQLTATRRESWIRLLGEPDRETVRDQLCSDARRFDLKELVSPYLNPDPGSGGALRDGLSELLEHLAMLRWWA
ncbi:MAG: hypothetical protein LBJ08_10595 [Bifidobacteriaceae bacterium]|nr:hypothetical protein [Bifidobacteriaceae bacterium]